MSKERRKFKRFDAYLSVKLRSPEAKKFSEGTLSNDLSRDGIKVSANSDIQKGSVLDLEISIPDDPKPVYTTGEVVWAKSKGAKKKSDYDLGIKFLVMDPVDKFRILDFAYNNWLETKVNDFQDPEDFPQE